MILLKNRYLPIVIGLLSMSSACNAFTNLGLGASIMRLLDAEYWLNKAHQGYAAKSCAVEEIKPELEPQTAGNALDNPLLERAHWLSDLIKHENKNNDNVELDSLSFRVLGPASNMWEISGEGVVYAMVGMGSRGKSKEAHIYLNRALTSETIAIQAQAILHELAHAYDIHFWNYGMNTDTYASSFNSYPYLKEYVEQCRVRFKSKNETMLPHEWYAQWQSLQWLKKYMPTEVSSLKDTYRQQAQSQNRDGIPSFEYPPAAILYQWL